MSQTSSQSEQERLREIYADLDPYNLTRHQNIPEESMVNPVSYTVVQQPSVVSVSGSSNLVNQSSLGQSKQEYQQQQINYQSSSQQNASSSQQNLGSSAQSSSAQSKFTITEKILNASNAPVDVNATETVCVNEQTGVYVNKQDESEWQGPVRISDYPINVDNNPEVISKQTNQVVNYTQDVTVKYLKPPSPPRTGEIIIKQECDMRVPKAPPLVIRQRPADPRTPETCVLREQPPQQPFSIEKKVISIAGKLLPPPPRKLVIEKLPQMPARPQAVVIEKWLPFDQQSRNVKFIRAQQTSQWPSEKNLVIEWDSARAVVNKQLHNLGTVQCDTEEYRRQYQNTLLSNSQMISVCREHNINLPADCNLNVNLTPRLVGDIDALKLIDLDRHGLSEYTHLFKSSNLSSSNLSSFTVQQPKQNVYLSYPTVTQLESAPQSAQIAQSVYESVFQLAQVNNGLITDVEARRLISLINERLSKTENKSRTDKFVQDVCNNDNKCDFLQFKKLVVNWVLV